MHNTSSVVLFFFLVVPIFGANITLFSTTIQAQPSTTYSFSDIVSSVEWVPGNVLSKFLYFGILKEATLVGPNITCSVMGACTFEGDLSNPAYARYVILSCNYTTPPAENSQILFKGSDGTSSFEYMLYFKVPDTTPTTSGVTSAAPFFLMIIFLVFLMI